jgi:hypothetical protein
LPTAGPLWRWSLLTPPIGQHSTPIPGTRQTQRFMLLCRHKLRCDVAGRAEGWIVKSRQILFDSATRLIRINLFVSFCAGDRMILVWRRPGSSWRPPQGLHRRRGQPQCMPRQCARTRDGKYHDRENACSAHARRRRCPRRCARIGHYGRRRGHRGISSAPMTPARCGPLSPFFRVLPHHQ